MLNSKFIHYSSIMRLGTCLILSLFYFLFLQAQDPKVSVDVEPSPRAGKPFAVTYHIKAKGSKIALSGDSKLKMLMGPNISQGSEYRYSSQSGGSSAVFTSYTYMFLADKSGSYQTPSATISSGKTQYHIKSKSFKVFSAEAKTAESIDDNQATGAKLKIDLNKGIFIKLILSKSTVYEQEGFMATFKLYSQYDVRFQNVEFPEFDGFLVQDVAVPQSIQMQPEELNGRIYLTGILKQSFLIPQRSGQLRIPTGKFELLVNVPVKSSGRGFDAIFDDFLGSTREIPKVVESKAQTINVKALPIPKPEIFNGSVGQFSLDVDVPQTVIRVGESFRIKAKLKGNGNIKLSQIIPPAFPSTFDVYEPQEESDIQITSSGSSGEKSIEFYAVPRSTGDFNIPAVEFVYFDPNVKEYKSISSESFKLHVDPSDGSTASVSESKISAERQKIGDDIRYLKQIYHSTGLKPVNFRGYILSYLAIAFLTSAVFLILRYRQGERQNIKRYRSKRASKQVKKQLKLAEQSLREGENERFYDFLLQGLTSYLSAKLHIPMSSWSREKAVSKLSGVTADETLLSQTDKLLAELELLRYGGGDSEDKKRRLYDKSAELINRIERLKLK